MRPSELDGEPNLNGEFMEYEVVVNDGMGDDIFLGRNDLARMGSFQMISQVSGECVELGSLRR